MKKIDFCIKQAQGESVVLYQAALENLRLATEEMLEIHRNNFSQNDDDSNVVTYMLKDILDLYSHLKYIVDEALLVQNHVLTIGNINELGGCSHE